MIDLEFRHAFPVRSGGFKMHVKLCSTSRRLALFGASGSGKTLTMQALAGLFTPREGRITALGRTFFDSALRLNLPARERNLGYLFQDYALFPHLTVRQNIAFALNTSLKSRKNIQKKQKVAEMLETFEIAHLADLRPSGISGGQKQRVALARALAGQPDLLLLDEPFSALDPLLRQRVREQCLDLLGRFDTPTVIISHDPADVRVFADAVSFYHRGENSACLSLADLRASASGLDAPVRELAQAILQDA